MTERHCVGAVEFIWSGVKVVAIADVVSAIADAVDCESTVVVDAVVVTGDVAAVDT